MLLYGFKMISVENACITSKKDGSDVLSALCVASLSALWGLNTAEVTILAAASVAAYRSNRFPVLDPKRSRLPPITRQYKK